VVALKEKITRIRFDIIVLGFLKDVRPLNGILANIDWIYSGAVSRMIIEEKISGSGGEALLMATGDKMKTPRVLLLGLGETATFSYNSILRFSSEITDRLRELRLVGGAIEIPELPGSRLDRARSFDTFISGFTKDNTIDITMLVKDYDTAEELE
jgi:hypothetical protein